MTQIGSFGQRTGQPNGLPRGEQQVVERRARQTSETDDESGRAVAELEELLLGIYRGVELRAPVGVRAGPIRCALHGVDDATLPRIPFLDAQKVPTPDQRQGRADEAMHSVKIG